MRARRKAAAAPPPLMFERQDWQLFLDHATLPQKAGCQPNEIGRVVIKEIVDNALDTGANVTLDASEDGYVVRDDGPGIDPAEVPWLFSVSRPLASSKLKRLPLRGMLGNGLRVVMGAVAALTGSISVESQGHRLTLAIDRVAGTAIVAKDEPVLMAPGTIIRIALRVFNGTELAPARLSIALAKGGTSYAGPSLPEWYGPAALHALFLHVVPDTTTVAEIVREVFELDHDDQRRAGSLKEADIKALHPLLTPAKRPPIDIGSIGEGHLLGHYAKVAGTASIDGATIPCCIECWATCTRAERGDGTVKTQILLNRTPSLAALPSYSGPDAILLNGLGVFTVAKGAKTAHYTITISLIAPYVQLANDGKTPALGDFGGGIRKALTQAAGRAYRAMVNPPKKMSIIDAAWAVMKAAYLKASDDGSLPANARQVMYAARPTILELTGADKLGDAYFTQTLLPDFIEEHPELCRDWDVVFDARGHFTEPHTGRVIPLGTIEVRSYLGDRPWLGPVVELNSDKTYPTAGPANRYRNILFVEKEGFAQLLQVAQIAERFDIAIMSTKGMSTTAARLQLDRLAPEIDKVLVLHDFDVAGFSIFGTLTNDGRRYTFDNKVPVVDIGLRLADVEAMALESEPVETTDWRARSATLRRHGASPEEIEFLKAKRVELNAMTSRQFIDFIERKLIEHGVHKVVPDIDIITEHARRLIEQSLAERALDKIRGELAEQAQAVTLPDDIEERLRNHLDAHREVPWDEALADIIEGLVS